VPDDSWTANESEYDSYFRAEAAGILGFIALVTAVALLLSPLGTTYDSDCGTLLQHPYPIATCEDRGHNRLILVAMAAFVALGLAILAVRWSRHRARAFVVVVGIAVLTVGGVVVGAPYGEHATTNAGVSFVLHCPGRFSEYGGQEHPPPGTEHVCSDADSRRAGLAFGVVGVAVLSSAAVILRDRRRVHV
jgi:hypothetical protein